MRIFYKIHPKLSFIRNVEDITIDPIIVRVNSFDEKSLEDFEEDLDEAHTTGQSVIPVVVDSYGGSAYGVLGFLAAIEESRLPVATILTTKAMSAGAILFCYGTEGYRFMHPHAQVMIHDVATTSEGKIEEIKADSRHLDDMNDTMYKRVSRHLGHKPNYLGDLIKEHKHVDWYLNAKEAKKHNIANHLRIPNFEVKVNLKMNFI